MNHLTFPLSVHIRDSITGRSYSAVAVTLLPLSETTIDLPVTHDQFQNQIEIVCTSNIADEQRLRDAKFRFAHEVGVVWLKKLQVCIDSYVFNDWYVMGGVDLQHAITKSVAVEDASSFTPVVRTKALIDNVCETNPLAVLYDMANYCTQGLPITSFIGSTTQPLTQQEREKILANGTFYSESPPNTNNRALPTDVTTLQRVLCQRSQRCLLCWADAECDCDEIRKMAPPPLFTIRLCFRALQDIVIKV